MTPDHSAPLVYTEADFERMARDGYIRPSHFVDSHEGHFAYFRSPCGDDLQCMSLDVPLCHCEQPLDAGVCHDCELVYTTVTATGDGWFRVAA